MKTILICCLTAILFGQQDSFANPFIPTAFTDSAKTDFKTPPEPPALNNLRCSVRDGRVFLDWNIEANQVVDQFAIERSPNGKVFYPTGLVFTSEKKGKDVYQFFETPKEENVAYRVLIIYKDHRVVYSPVVYINPETAVN